MQSRKRHKLPSADEVLIGGAASQAPPETEPKPKTPQKAPKQKSTKALQQNSAKTEEQKGTKLHVSTYLTSEVVAQLEDVRLHLLRTYHRKLTKSQIIERALRIGLTKPEDLLGK